MANYRLNFKSSAAKEFRKLPLIIQQKIVPVIDQLCENPRPSSVVKLQGDENLYRVRVGDYRIIYEIDDIEKYIRVMRVMRSLKIISLLNLITRISFYFPHFHAFLFSSSPFPRSCSGNGVIISKSPLS